MLKLIQHLVVKDDGTLPETPDCLYAYILAGNGVFLNAKRTGLDVLIPVCSSQRSWFTGIDTLCEPILLVCHKPLAPYALELARSISFPDEILFWFNAEEYWTMDVPQQLTSLVQRDACRKLRRNGHERAGRPTQSRCVCPLLQHDRQQRRAGISDLCGHGGD